MPELCFILDLYIMFVCFWSFVCLQNIWWSYYFGLANSWPYLDNILDVINNQFWLIFIWFSWFGMLLHSSINGGLACFDLVSRHFISLWFIHKLRKMHDTVTQSHRHHQPIQWVLPYPLDNFRDIMIHFMSTKKRIFFSNLMDINEN